MKLIKVAAIALLLAFAPATAAGAQTCTDDPAYCESVENDGAGADTEVSPSADEGVTGGGNAEAGANADAGAGAATAPSGTLPFTGGDVVGIAIIGAAAIGLGALLVRRSKAGHQAT